jgi:hypothetical protein
LGVFSNQASDAIDNPKRLAIPSIPKRRLLNYIILCICSFSFLSLNHPVVVSSQKDFLILFKYIRDDHPFVDIGCYNFYRIVA